MKSFLVMLFFLVSSSGYSQVSYSEQEIRPFMNCVDKVLRYAEDSVYADLQIISMDESSQIPVIQNMQAFDAVKDVARERENLVKIREFCIALVRTGIQEMER